MPSAYFSYINVILLIVIIMWIVGSSNAWPINISMLG